MAKQTKKTEKEFNFRTITSFEAACAKENIDPLKLPDVSMLPVEFQKAIINAYKLFVIFKAINNGWRPDWANKNQTKYFPWFRVSSSGLVFVTSGYGCGCASTACGSRLCTDSSEKALYIAEQFGINGQEYKEFFLYLD